MLKKHVAYKTATALSNHNLNRKSSFELAFGEMETTR